MSKYNYLLYVRKYNIISNDYELYIYQTNTTDIFHTMGEMMYRSMEQIKQITFKEWNAGKIAYWENENYTIYEWKDKYFKENKNDN